MLVNDSLIGVSGRTFTVDIRASYNSYYAIELEPGCNCSNRSDVHVHIHVHDEPKQVIVFEDAPFHVCESATDFVCRLKDLTTVHVLRLWYCRLIQNIAEKNVPNFRCCSFVKHGPIFIIFSIHNQHTLKNVVIVHSLYLFNLPLKCSYENGEIYMSVCL